MEEKIICTSECEDCKKGTLDDSNKARLKIYCAVKDKNLYFGQMVQCGYKEKKK